MAYSNIPKVVTNLTDGNLRSVVDPTTPKVTLLGMTDNTTPALNEPTRIIGNVTIKNYDRVDGKPSELSRAIQECFDAGADNIEVMVIRRDLAVNDGGSATADDRFAALETAYSLLEDHPVDIVVPVGAYIDETLSSSNNFGWQLAAHCHKNTENFDSCIGIIPTTRPVSGTTEGGLASITIGEMQTWVTAVAAYDTSALQGSDFTTFDGTTDAGSNGVPDTYAFWATSDEAIPTGSPPRNDAQVVEDANNEPVDIGKFISVVAGLWRFRNNLAPRFDPTNNAYDSDGAAAYAGLVASLPPHISPTNKAISGPEPIRNISLTQANTLAGSRFVTFREKGGVTKVVNAMTGAYNISTAYRSDYVRLTTVRIVHEVADRIRKVADPFIGLPNNGINRSALRAQIDQAVGRLQVVGALERYAFKLISPPSSRVLGQITVNVTLVPAFEITQITQNIGLSEE